MAALHIKSMILFRGAKKEEHNAYKKYLALALSAILMLVFCTGCKGDKPALTQLLADMLESQYPYLQVEIHPELEEALVHSVKKGGTEEEILAQVVEDLKLTGRIITFEELEDGRRGDHALDTVFQAGSDYTAAARSTLNQWAPVLNSLHRNGKYIVNLAMIEENGGYHIAADIYVEKAGSSHSQNNDDEEKEDPEEDNGPSYTKETERDDEGRIVFTIHKPEGLQDMLDENGGPTGSDIVNAHIDFDDNIGDIHLKNWVPIGGTTIQGINDVYFTGVFDGGSGNHLYLNDFDLDSLSSEGVNPYIYIGLFGLVGSNATIENVSLTVNVKSIRYQYGISFGGIAGVFRGGKAIRNCDVTFAPGGLHITATDGENGDVGLGGIVGLSIDGLEISNCRVRGDLSAETAAEQCYVGGIAGTQIVLNKQVEITGCTASGSIFAQSSAVATAGGVVGALMPDKKDGITMPQNNWEGNSGTIRARVGKNFVDATASENGTEAKGTVSGFIGATFETAANAGTLIGYDTDKDVPVANTQP